MKPETIPIISQHGLEPNTIQSMEAKQWLSYVMYKDQVQIRCVLDGKEVSNLYK